MPAKPFDINEYIKSLKLSDEEEKAMRPILEKPERLEEIKRGWNSQSESSRLVDEANTLKTAAAAEKAEADRIKAEAEAALAKNQTWHDALKLYEGETQATKVARDALAEEKELLTAKNAGYEAYLKSLNVDPMSALEGVHLPKLPVRQEPPVLEPKATAPVFDEETMKKYGLVTAKQVQPAIDLLGNIPFQLTALNFRHMELYGKPMPSTELDALRTDYLNPQNTRSLDEIAAEKFHFADREKALAAEALEKEASRRAEEMFTKRMSELNLPSAALDSLTPGSLENAARFASETFAKNSGRAAEANATQIGQEEMQAFLQVNEELAQKGVHATP